MNVKDTPEYKIGTVKELDDKILQKFYMEYFKHRKYSLVEYWKWQYRTEQNHAPLVATIDNQIAAHSGYIPFILSVYGEKVPARWYIDFMVAKDFRRQGLGSILTERLMSLGGITFAATGNDKSMGAFRKLKWKESSDSYLVYLPINPKSLPFLNKKFSKPIFVLVCTLLKIFYLLNAFRFIRYRRSVFTEIEIDNSSINYLNTNKSGIGEIYPLRDTAFWSWRILKSPDLERYRLKRIDGSYILLKEIEDAFGRINIDLLYMDQSLNMEQRLELIKKLYIWSSRKGYGYVRLYTTNSYFKKRLRSTCGALDSAATFAYYVHSNVNSSISSHTFDFQFVDNDFEDL